MPYNLWNKKNYGILCLFLVEKKANKTGYEQ